VPHRNWTASAQEDVCNPSHIQFPPSSPVNLTYSDPRSWMTTQAADPLHHGYDAACSRDQEQRACQMRRAPEDNGSSSASNNARDSDLPPRRPRGFFEQLCGTPPPASSPQPGPALPFETAACANHLRFRRNLPWPDPSVDAVRRKRTCPLELRHSRH